MIKMQKDFMHLAALKELTGAHQTSRWQVRIFAELRFACLLSESLHGRFDAEIAEAVALLERDCRSSGCVTRQSAEAAEAVLAPLAVEAKSFRYLCVAHAHIDMNWMWGYDETVGTTVDTFRTMLDIMREYPSFTFSQSQASVYKIVEEHDPGMLEEIRARVREGRWEITASTWVETDKNMPSGESLSRHMLYTKDYIGRTFGIPPEELEIDFEPDTFGHSRHVPEILRQGGIRYYYHCRGHVGEDILHRWRAPSGAEVLLYTEPFWYNADIDSEIGEYALELERLTGARTLLKVYGVGDHGGGPTRRDVERLMEMDSWPIFPRFTFGTLREYFKTLESRRDTFKVLEGEINFLCDGCYTTQSRIKAGNRKSEAMLREAEWLGTFASLRTGSPYPVNAFSAAWIRTLFNQFHDIIPGSGVTETREYASGLYQEVFAAARTKSKIAVKQIIDRIDTSALIPMASLPDIRESRGEGAGSGFGQFGRSAGRKRIFHLFNPAETSRTEVAEILVWDYEGDTQRLVAETPEGEALPAQFLGQTDYWGHTYVRLLTEVTVPAFGYATLVVCENKDIPSRYSFINDMRVQAPERFVLENECIRAELDSLDGSLSSFVDKATGEELAAKSGAATFRFVHEAVEKAVTGWGGGMSAWFVGRHKNRESVNRNLEMKPIAEGPLRKTIQYKTTFGQSDLSVEVSLDKGSDALQFSVTCNWREFGSDAAGVPALHFILPLPYRCETYLYDVPFGFAERMETDMDLPANSFVAARNLLGEKSLMLASRSKYGYRCDKDQIALTLIRGAYDPDPTPETGTHRIEFMVRMMDSAAEQVAYARQSEEYRHPLMAYSGTAHQGDLPLSDALIRVQSGSVMISGVKMPESGKDDALLVRLYETEGKETTVRLQCGFEIGKAWFADVLEQVQPESGVVLVQGSEASFSLKPFQVANLLIGVEGR